MPFSDAELFENYGRGRQYDPRKNVIKHDFFGIATMALGNRASTIKIDEDTQGILVAGKLTKWWKKSFSNMSEDDQVAAGYGIHTAALADGLKGLNRKLIDIRDKDGNLSVEILKLVDAALQGGAVGSGTDINLRIGNFDLYDPEGPFLEIVVDGRKASDILRFEGKVASELLLEFSDFDYAADIDHSGSTVSETIDISGYAQGDVRTGSGNDTITGSEGSDSIASGSGNDFVYLGAGDDTVIAGEGDDRIIAGNGAGDDFIDGGPGNDYVEYPSCTEGITIDLRPIDRSATAFGGTMVGAALMAQGYAANEPVGISTGSQIGTDLLIGIENAIGGSGDDAIIGNDLDNRIGSGGGNDTIDGGNGFDHLLLPGEPDDYEVIYDTSTDDGTFILCEINGNGSNDLRIKSIEGLIFPNAERLLSSYTGYIDRFVNANNDPVIGTPANEFFHGDDRDNHLIGNDGENYFVGGAGEDTIDGNDLYGDGSGKLDALDYASEELGGGAQGVYVNLATGEAVDSYGFSDVILDIERVYGTSFDDELIGSDRTDSSEAFDPMGGNDEIHAGGGRDNLFYHLAEGVFGGSSGIEVQLSSSVEGSGIVVSDPFGFTDTFSGIESIRATEFADLFSGGSGYMEIQPLAGSDTIIADPGSDLTVVYRSDANYGGTAGVTVRLDLNYAIDGFGDQDSFNGWIANIEGTGSADYIQGNTLDNRLHGGAGNDEIRGGDGDDHLFGDSGDDVLAGQGGNNRLSGGDGDDTLISTGGSNVFFGGNGDDEFLFYAGGTNTIGDFNVGQDRLQFSPGISLGSMTETDINNDGTQDTVLQMQNGLTVNLLSVNGVSGIGALTGQTLPETFGSVFRGIDGADFSGFSVSSAGDVNGDGFYDVIIGAFGADPNGDMTAGESYLVFGAADGFDASFDLSSLDGSNGFALKGIDPDDNSGRAVSTAGDINGDGFDDILIGALGADPNGNFRAGESYLVFGAAGGFDASLDLASLNGSDGFTLSGIDILDWSAGSVSSAGDINGDGYWDFLIGALGGTPSGNVRAGESYVVFGGAGGFDARLDLAALDGNNGFTLNGIDPDDFSGSSVSYAGDVNGDGYDDVLIGAHRAAQNGGSEAGESYLVFGSAGGFDARLDLASLDGSNGFVLNGIDGFDRSGMSVSSAGDLNGDGYDDILLGAYGGDPNGSDSAGESYLVFGAAGGFDASLNLSSLDGSNGFTLNGIDSADRSGWSVSSAGDTNGDGFDDVLIGAYSADPNGNVRAGESYLILGAAGGFGANFDLSSLDGSNGFILNGIDELDYSGRSVSAAGDVNGDGYDDILIGAYSADFNGLTDAGETYLIYGGTDILNRFDLADGVQDGEVQLALLGENPADYDLPV
ncbi:integrins alpha chain [Rhodobacterales bacterium Y4I]|nr:integrins alpha chain [Rhodobacterales bacterium Y4I]